MVKKKKARRISDSSVMHWIKVVEKPHQYLSVSLARQVGL